MSNFIYCFYFDEYDEEDMSGLFIDSTKYIIPKLKYYQRVYNNNISSTYYYEIDQDCYQVMKKFKLEYPTLNATGCYDLIYVTNTTLEDFFNKNLINFTKIYLSEEILDFLTNEEFNLLLTEL